MTQPDDPFRKRPDEAYAPPPVAGSGASGQGWGTPPPGGEGGGGWGSPAPGDGSRGWGNGPGPAPRGVNGVAVAALVVGVLALLSSITVLGGILLGLVAVVLGVVGLRRSRRGAGGGAMAGIGLGLGAVGLLIGVGIAALGFSFLNSQAGQDLQSCLQEAGGDVAAQQQCQQDFADEVVGG